MNFIRKYCNALYERIAIRLKRTHILNAYEIYTTKTKEGMIEMKRSALLTITTTEKKRKRDR